MPIFVEDAQPHLLLFTTAGEIRLFSLMSHHDLRTPAPLSTSEMNAPLLQWIYTHGVEHVIQKIHSGIIVIISKQVHSRQGKDLSGEVFLFNSNLNEAYSHMCTIDSQTLMSYNYNSREPERRPCSW